MTVLRDELPEDWGCGCCGVAITTERIWCPGCDKHVLKDGRPFWDRTYEAQHGKPCPFDVAQRT